jgi:hypothetical protein
MRRHRLRMLQRAAVGEVRPYLSGSDLSPSFGLSFFSLFLAPASFYSAWTGQHFASMPVKTIDRGGFGAPRIGPVLIRGCATQPGLLTNRAHRSDTNGQPKLKTGGVVPGGDMPRRHTDYAGGCTILHFFQETPANGSLNFNQAEKLRWQSTVNWRMSTSAGQANRNPRCSGAIGHGKRSLISCRQPTQDECPSPILIVLSQISSGFSPWLAATIRGLWQVFADQSVQRKLMLFERCSCFIKNKHGGQSFVPSIDGVQVIRKWIQTNRSQSVPLLRIG